MYALLRPAIRFTSAALLCAAALAVNAELATDAAARAHDAWGRQPLAFVRNAGQLHAGVAWSVESPRYQLWFDPRGHLLRLTAPSPAPCGKPLAHVIRVDLIGAQTRAIEGRDPGTGVVSHFRGARAQWQAGLPVHTGITYVEPWPGIELSYRSNAGQLESVYTVAPHADPRRIAWRYSGQQDLHLDERGQLVYRTVAGAVTETAPIVYQEAADGTRTTVPAAYRLIDASTVGFELLAAYDRSRPLVIDPTLVYSGYIGGAGIDEARGIAVDAAGNAYITGHTFSAQTSFPVQVGPDLTFNGLNGNADVFVTKLSPTGQLLYSGYIGGSNGQFGVAIAVDDAGHAYIAGRTTSPQSSFPVVAGPDLTYNFATDGFIAKLNPAGTQLLYSGYIGGGESDSIEAIAVDGAGNAYVAGNTGSGADTFPVLVGPDASYNGEIQDAFVAKVNTSGQLVYAGYIGGALADSGTGIAVDQAGAAYVTGLTASDETTFPVLIGPDLSNNGIDGFIAKVRPDGTGLAYAGFVSSNGDVFVADVDVDAAGHAYITGHSSFSTDFPVTVGPDLEFNGAQDAFVGKLRPDGSGYLYLGWVGGAGADQARAIVVDSLGGAYLTGRTSSNQDNGFPLLSGPDLTHNGGFDAFVARVNPAGTALTQSGFLGGLQNEVGHGIGLDGQGHVLIAGVTESTQTSFPILAGPDGSANGSFDAFAAKLTGTGGGAIVPALFRDGFE